MKFISKTLAAFNRIDPRILVFVVLSVFFLGFRPAFNEEQYFGYAKAFINKNWLPGSFLFSDFPGGRLLFQYIAGFALKYLTFEQLTFFGRLFMYILFAFPVAAIARLLRINNVLLVFWLAALYIPQQSFIGGAWIFGGLESKSFAYLFVLWSLYFLLRRKHLPAVLFAAFATWWHFLAAGWYGLYLFIFMFLYRWKDDRRIVWYWIGYAVIQLPLLIYLYTGLMSGSPVVINGVNTNYVYTYIRNPHHIGIFRTWDYFYHYHIMKVVFTILGLFLAVRVFRRNTAGMTRDMNRLLTIILIQVLIFVPIAWLDKNGVLMKTYPFRGSAVGMILFQLLLIVLLRDKWIPALRKKRFRSIGRYRAYIAQLSLLLLVTFFILGLKIITRIDKFESRLPRWKEIDAVALALQEESKPGDDFFLLCPETRFSLSLPRKAGRDGFFYHKYIPTTSADIYEWYQRYLWKKKLMADPGMIPVFEKDHHVPFFVTCKDIHNAHLKKVYANDTYRIYQYNP